jgi:hypothetical protein
MLSVTYKPLMLSVIMLSVVMLWVVMLNVVVPLRGPKAGVSLRVEPKKVESALKGAKIEVLI